MARSRQTSLSAEKEAEAQALACRIRELADEEVVELARLLVSKPEHEVFGDTEFELRDIVLRVGAKALEEHLRQKKNGYRGCSIDCPACEQAAEFHGDRAKSLLSLLGAIEVGRAYYYCHRCGGQFPWDQPVGLTPKRLTPGAERATSLAGLLTDSFEEAAAKVLPELSGLRLSETTVQHTTEAAGERLGHYLDGGNVLGGPTRWPWQKDADGRTCAYISVDATGVRQQAKGGGAADGRMPYVGMIYNPVPELPDDSPHRPPAKAQMQARYVAGLYALDQLETLLRRQGAQVGMDRADRWIGLADGGNGLEPFVVRSFPRVEVVILDFWHVSDHLGNLARTMHPQDEDKAKDQKGQWCHLLKHQGGAAVIARLEALPVPQRGVLRTQHEEVLNYLRHNVERMDYPRYQAKGWLIGSGAVESACKTVVAQRLKLAGMRWREPGTDALCHLRALYKSEASQWRCFWQRKPPN